MKSKIIFLTLLLLFFIRPAFTIYEQRDKYFFGGYNQKFESYKYLYYSSQYVQKKNPIIIPDEIFELFTAGAYLNGLNPILITHDHPPMGRYILAVSIYFFDNANPVFLLLCFFSLLGIFYISKEVFGSSIIALIPMGIFANEPLFLDKLVHSPTLEPIQLPFIIFAMLAFIKGIQAKKYFFWFIATAFLLGFVISTRFFIIGVFLVISMYITFLLINRDIRRIVVFTCCLPLSIVVLLVSYTITFFAGYNIIKVLGIQKYIYFYHKSKFILPFTFWDLFLFNRWHTWWGDRSIIPDSNWILFWPLSFVLSLANIILSLVRLIKFNPAEIFLMVWLAMYILMLSTGYTSTRYFLPIIPFFYILSISLILKLYKKYYKK